MTIGDRLPRTTTLTGTAGDDSPQATQLILLGYPIACPTCGSQTRITDTPTGWRCTNVTCNFSTT